jgi:hypothetical protein
MEKMIFVSLKTVPFKNKKQGKIADEYTEKLNQIEPIYRKGRLPEGR